MGKSCFIIQPFDNGDYDKRYKETYLPAIEASGFTPYRVDEDSSASIPIYEIESRIARADVCFADISVDNPNVWCEVGLSIAHQKDICLICAKSRGKLPFDVQHRQVIFYSTSAASDFNDLQAAIKKRLLAISEKLSEMSNVSQAIIKVGNLQSEVSPFETAVLGVLASDSAFNNESIDISDLRGGVDKLGFTAVAANAGMRMLLKKKFIDTRREENERGYSYLAVLLTEKGWDWIESNIAKFNLRHEPQSGRQVSGRIEIIDDDIPF